LKVLVDSSIFIHFLRTGSNLTLARLIESDSIILSQIVYLEVLAGTKKQDRSKVKRILSGLDILPNFPDPIIVFNLLELATGSGIYGGIPDIMILADAKQIGALLFSADRKLLALAKQVKVATLKAF
jgi:predicted nucleic acid-binding protein